VASNLEPSAHASRESGGLGLGAICLAVSLILHSVLAPLPNLSAWLRPHARATPPVMRAALNEIPVDLSNDSLEGERAPAPAPAKDVEPPVAPSRVATEHESSAEPATESVEKPRAQRQPRAPGQPAMGTRTQASDSHLDIGARAISNNSHVLGSSLVNDCSLSVLIDISRVRTHPLAAQLSGLLVEWQDLFAKPGFDPLGDVDRLLVVGPELRASGRGLAVVQHHLDAARIQEALARVAARPAPATRAQGHFYLQLSPDLLLMAPERDSLRPIKDFALATPPEGSIGTLYVDAPSRALANLPINVPPGIHWLRGIILASGDNDVALDVEAGDESNELAKRHAGELTRSVLSLKTKTHARLIERALFEAREGESVIVGRLEVTSLQLGALLEVLSDRVKAPADPAPPGPAASADDQAEPEQPVTGEARRAGEAPPIDVTLNAPDAAAQRDGGKGAM
jgi:hypothetical protein